MRRIGLRRTTGLLVFTVLCAAPRGLVAQEPGGDHLELPQVLEVGTDGPTLIIVPCAGCGARSWLRFMDVNQDRFHMLAVTLPGYAGSPRPALPLWSDQTVFQDNAIEQISRLIDERSLIDVVLVGQSFGALMALRVATARPDVVRAVINVDGSPANPANRAEESLEERLANARTIVDEDWALRLQDPEQYRTFNGPSRDLDEAEKINHHGMFMASDRVSMVHYWRENLLRDRNPEFAALPVPYLDIKAISPRAVNPDSILAAHDARVESAGRPRDFRQVVFHDTSHWIHVEQPRALATVFEDFLADRPLTDFGPFEMGHVERVGTGARDVILMPCLGCDWRSWDDFMQRNVGQYRMFALTWPGMGDTPLPEVIASPGGTPYYDHLSRALELLIRREQMSRPVVVGHSAAATLAVRFGAEFPELVGGVVNVDAIVANGDTYGFTPEQRLAWANAEMAEVLERYDSDDDWRALNSTSSVPDRERAAFYVDMWLTPPRQNVLAYWRDWLRTDVGRLLPDLQPPFLAVHALSADPERAHEKRRDLEERYRRAPLPPGSRVVYVEDAGHSIWEWKPADFDRILRAFITGDLGS